MATVTEELARILATARAYSQTRAAFLGTHDRDHALTLLREAANASGVEFYLFSPASRQRWNSSKFVYENCGQACADPNALLQSAGAIKMPALIAFEEFLPLLRTDGGDRAARVQLADMLSGSSRSEAHLLVFVEPPETETHIPNTVGGHVSRFSLPMPAPRDLTLVAREEILSTAHVRHQNLQPQVVEEWSRRFASALAGLTQSAARFSMQDTLLNKTPDFPAALSCLQDQKSRLLSQRLRMRILDASTADPPIGLDYVYEYLRYNRHRIGVPGRDRAKGILLVGPPGTGKSQFARSASRFLGMPELVEFRIAALMHSLLGATENRFAEALAVLDAMAPVCVFINEIEKAFGDDSGSESTGGTMLRAVGSLLSWMSDSESATFTIATAIPVIQEPGSPDDIHGAVRNRAAIAAHDLDIVPI